MKPLDFAHAIFERRLTDAGISVEFIDGHPFGNKETVHMNEPLHETTAHRVVEAVENLARTVVHTADGKRAKVKCTRINIGSADIKISVLSFERAS